MSKLSNEQQNIIHQSRVSKKSSRTHIHGVSWFFTVDGLGWWPFRRDTVIKFVLPRLITWGNSSCAICRLLNATCSHGSWMAVVEEVQNIVIEISVSLSHIFKCEQGIWYTGLKHQSTMFRKVASLLSYFLHHSPTLSGLVFLLQMIPAYFGLSLQGHGSCCLLCPGPGCFCLYYALFISYTEQHINLLYRIVVLSAFFNLISLPWLTWITYYDKSHMSVIQTSLQNLPRTAHGKLKAVITPTIPRGFHTCWPTLSLDHIIIYHK